MRKKIIIPLLLSVVFLTTLFNGCGMNSDTPMFGKIIGLNDNQVMRIEESICGKTEAAILILNITNQYKEDFGGEIKNDVKISDMSMDDYIKTNAKDELSVVYTLSALFDKNNLELTDEENDSLDLAAKLYFDSLSDEEKKYADIDVDSVKALYTNYYKADKYYENKTEGIAEEVSDEDARAIKVQYIFIENNAEVDAQETLKHVKKQVEKGYQDFIVQANKYTQAKETEVYLYKNKALEEWQKQAFELQDNKLTDVIKQEDGYYLVKCVSAYEEGETAKNKAKIIIQNKTDAVKKEYDDFIGKLSKDFNKDAWNDISVPKTKDLKNTSLFEIYDKYLK
ncbi:MAG: peptidylprolyl isomerase [Lachnospiraceae bacterium]|nr:peptidylprolyl isomerase [Lachnospiraceae bacterium]